MSPPSSPSPRHYLALTYHTQADRVMLFGGFRGGNETWAYDYDTDTWVNRQPVTSPPERMRHTIAYDAAANRAVLHGGLGTELYGDTWEYDFDTNTWVDRTPPPAEVPTAPRNLRGSALETRVNLAWDSPASDGGSSIIAYRVYRGTTPGDLTFLTEADGSTHEDISVSYEVTYYYAVNAVNGVGEGPRSEEVPVRPVDTTNPTITISTPADRMELDTISVRITGTASDNHGVEKVELSTDGVNWVPTSGKTEWAGDLTLSDGQNIIRARATDVSGNWATATISVTVRPPGPDLAPWILAMAVAAISVVGVGVFMLARKGR